VEVGALLKLAMLIILGVFVMVIGAQILIINKLVQQLLAIVLEVVSLTVLNLLQQRQHHLQPDKPKPVEVGALLKLAMLIDHGVPVELPKKILTIFMAHQIMEPQIVVQRVVMREHPVAQEQLAEIIKELLVTQFGVYGKLE
jgi:hypothetical protein